jgi:iron complex outermembrane receptor protein
LNRNPVLSPPIQASLFMSKSTTPSFTSLKTMVKLLFVLFLLAAPGIIIAAPPAKGIITGKIVTSDGQPAEYATVTLDDKKAIRVGKDGVFRIENLEVGKYTLAVSFAGQEPQTRIIEITGSETVDANFSLAVSARALNEVVIVGNKYSVTARKKSNTAARLPISYLENPQAYSVVDKELIGEQMALTLEESFRNVPGAVPAKTGAGMPAFASRGFYNTENLRNGMATFLRTGIDLVSVERVEAIKGPSGTLFGGPLASFGGLVNYITKKPYQKFGGEVTYTTGSFELNRVTADINAPLNDDKTVLFRINMAAQNKNDFQDQGHGSTVVIAPSLSYQVNEKLSFRFDADVQTYKGTSNTAWRILAPTAVKVTSLDQFKLDFKRSLIDNSFIGKQLSRNFYAQAEYKLSGQWTSQTSFSAGSGEYNDLNYFYQGWLTDTTIQRAIDVFSPDKTGRTQIQQNFTGDFKIGAMRNRLVVGLDHMAQYRNYKYTGVIMDTVNINQPARDVRVQRLEDMVAGISSPAFRQAQKTFGAYFSDVLNLTGQLMVMVSLRVDNVNNEGTKNMLSQVVSVNSDYSQTLLSPKLGVVYQPVKEKVAIFANYMNGFSNQADVFNPGTSTIVTGKPRFGNQWEGGVKLDVMKNKLSATVSYYHIAVTNAQRLDATANVYRFDGTQESKGVEAEVIGNLFPGFNFVSGYGYNDNKYTKASVALTGKKVVGAPNHVGNFWGSYSLLKGSLKGLGFGAGAIYASKSFVNDINTVTMPSYTVMDATIFYNTPQFRLGFKVNNITNEKYWVSDAFYSHPQATANFLATIAYKF